MSDFEHPVHETGELVGQRGDRLGGTEFAAKAPILCAEIALTAEEGGRGESQGRGGAIDHRPGASTKHLAAGDAIVRTEPEPGGEMVFGGPPRHIETDFADHGLGDADVDAIDPREVDAADAVEFATEIELRGMTAGVSSPLRS